MSDKIIRLQQEAYHKLDILLLRKGKIDAARFVRDVSGKGLHEAMNFIDEIYESWFMLNKAVNSEDVPGQETEVFAIGPFSRSIAKHLGRAEANYENVPEGYPVVVILFLVYNTDFIRALAECFGIEPWDFSRHKLKPNAGTVKKLRRLFYAELDTVDDFEVLLKAGFDFYFYIHNS